MSRTERMMTELELWRASLPPDLRRPNLALCVAIVAAHSRNARHDLAAAVERNCGARAELMRLPEEVLRDVRGTR